MGYLIDIDGTLLNGDLPCPGAVEFMEKLNAGEEKYLLMTNSIRAPEKQSSRLRKAGISVEAGRILSPIVAINGYLEGKGITRARIIGTEEEISQVKALATDTDPGIVILLDFEKGNLGYRELQLVLDDMQDGVEVVTASLSPYYLRGNRRIIDTGAFAGLLETVSGKSARNFGKPSGSYFAIAGKMLDEEPGGVQVIGDDWSTDIKGANAWGGRSVLVKSGKYADGDEEKERPGRVVGSLREVLG